MFPDYRSVFTEGFILAPYENDPDRSFFRNLHSLYGGLRPPNGRGRLSSMEAVEENTS